MKFAVMKVVIILFLKDIFLYILYIYAIILVINDILIHLSVIAER